jgi:hypothetical protein
MLRIITHQHTCNVRSLHVGHLLEGGNIDNNKMNCELMLTYDTPALRQTGSRSLTGQKTLPTIWGTYMKLVIYRGKRFWTHQIPTSCLPT